MNEVDSFDNTIDIPSKFITFDRVISSDCVLPNISEPVNEYVTSSKLLSENDQRISVVEIVYVSIPFSVDTNESSGLLLPLFIVIGVTKDFKFSLPSCPCSNTLTTWFWC